MAAGIDRETVRYYEQQGLLPGTTRTASGYRKYSSGALRRLEFIHEAKGLGFTLAEIRELLELSSYRERDCYKVLIKAQRKQEEVRQKIRNLHALYEALDRLTTACSGRCRIDECPILAALSRGPNPAS